jgi:hypothetical protein
VNLLSFLFLHTREAGSACPPARWGDIRIAAVILSSGKPKELEMSGMIVFGGVVVLVIGLGVGLFIGLGADENASLEEMIRRSKAPSPPN